MASTTANETAQNTASAKPVSKARKVFARTFGIPGLVFSILAMAFAVAMSFYTMTLPSLSNVLENVRIPAFSLVHLSKIPMISCYAATFFFSLFGVLFSVLSKFLGTKNRINSSAMVLSLVAAGAVASIMFIAVPIGIFIRM